MAKMILIIFLLVFNVPLLLKENQPWLTRRRDERNLKFLIAPTSLSNISIKYLDRVEYKTRGCQFAYVPAIQWSAFEKCHPEKQRSESLNKISRLPPPGGTMTSHEVSKVILKSFFIATHLARQLHLKSVVAEIHIDAGYESIVGDNSASFLHFVYMQFMSLFLESEYAIDNIFVSKGSLKISYEVTKRSKLVDVSNANYSTNFYKIKHNAKSISSDHIKHILRRKSGRQPSLAVNERQNNIMPTKLKHLVRRNAQTDMSSGSQMAPTEHLASLNDRSGTEGQTKLRIRFKLDAAHGAGGEDEGRLKNHIKRQVAREIRVPLSSIQDFSLDPGMEVSFVLTTVNDENNVLDDRSIAKAADELKTNIRTKQFRILDLDGRPLMAFKGSLSTSTDGGADLSPVLLGVLICVLILIGILVILACILARNSWKKRKKSGRSKDYRDTAVQETGRDSIQSIGRYSYDSGLWLGPGPEPLYTVPDAPQYRPPTREEVASTPRPTTSVRTRLRKSWNVDPDRPLPPIPDDVIA